VKAVIWYLAAALILMAALFWNIPAGARFYGYGAMRELMKVYTIISTWRMDKISSEHFSVRFAPERRAEAEMVLDVAEYFYFLVASDFNFSPGARIPLILYSSREELNKNFGWGAEESAMGVYWAGTIRVLAPSAWIGESEAGRVKEKFISSGPVAHELAHLMVDYLTGGNYPRWFTEGVAQYEEYKLTGFIFNDVAGSPGQPLYSMRELAGDFDGLSNQSLAYRESFAAVYYIVQFHGEDALHELILKLGEGCNLDRAMEKVLGMDLQEFEAGWQEWYASSMPVRENMDDGRNKYF